MGNPSKGFIDKLYWRQAGTGWHCFEKLAKPIRDKPDKYCGYCSGRGDCVRCRERKARVVRYGSLCGVWQMERSGGQDCRRPYPLMRCARCDNLEMQMRGWDEPGIESKSFLDLHEFDFRGAKP